MDRGMVLIPGARLGPHQPLLSYTWLAGRDRGAEAYHVEWPADRPPFADSAAAARWVIGQIAAVLAAFPVRRPVLVGKSLGTYAAALAAERGLPGHLAHAVAVRPAVRRRVAPGARAVPADRRHRGRAVGRRAGLPRPAGVANLTYQAGHTADARPCRIVRIRSSRKKSFGPGRGVAGRTLAIPVTTRPAPLRSCPTDLRGLAIPASSGRTTGTGTIAVDAPLAGECPSSGR